MSRSEIPIHAAKGLLGFIGEEEVPASVLSWFLRHMHR